MLTFATIKPTIEYNNHDSNSTSSVCKLSKLFTGVLVQPPYHNNSQWVLKIYILGKLDASSANWKFGK